MSDLIERLRRDGYTIGGWDEALSELEAQQAEIARLRELIKGSYQEGFEDAQHQASSWEIRGHEETWELSSTRKALEQKP